MFDLSIFSHYISDIEGFSPYTIKYENQTGKAISPPGGQNYLWYDKLLEKRGRRGIICGISTWV
jgi:hypothetical protein